MTRDHDILLTGATGFLGKVVLHELVRRREALGVNKIRLLLRTNGSGNAAGRFTADIASSPCFANFAPGWHNDIEMISCDLGQPNAGIESQDRAAIATGVTHIINCAASVQFDLPLRNAATANIATALEMLGLAKECQRLESLVSVSTAYVTPHQSDEQPIVEELAPLPAPAAELYERIMRGGLPGRQRRGGDEDGQRSGKIRPRAERSSVLAAGLFLPGADCLAARGFERSR